MSSRQKRMQSPPADPQISMEVKPDAAKPGFKVNRTIVLTEENDFKLKVMAAKERIDASALVNRLISPHLRGIRVSFPKGLPSPALDDAGSEDEAAG